ncbi:hypothetical protein B0H34DRAFT_683618 [Crassisporium funariophilum]|nr:hypothetical protein B0H34DRAFT_683618 [Crassisporium funariophilum]
MTSRRASPTPRRVVALKRVDGEPLTRADVQYDLLEAIFADTHQVFSDPYHAGDAEPLGKLTFRDLYIKSILYSPKATKALKDKMSESPIFALDFAMLSLLVNVGRVNTTMSFFPEMKTTIRTYHPIPSLQHTSGNMQDAPRIKHILKTSLLDAETKNPPASPADIITRCKNEQPSTSITNLIFVLAHHTGPVGQSHFHGDLDFIDLFIRTDVSSASRARAFLWLCYNYLELPSTEDDYDEEAPPNPFSDPAKKSTPPSFSFLLPGEQENQESEEDLILSEKLVAQRTRIIQTQGTKESVKTSNKASVNGSIMGDDEEQPIPPPQDVKGKGKRGGTSSAARGKRPTTVKEKIPIKPKEKLKEREPISHLADLEDDASDDNLADAFAKHRTLPRHQQLFHHQYEHPVDRFSSRSGPPPMQKHVTSPERSYGVAHRHRYSPYGQTLAHPSSSIKDLQRSRHKHQSHNIHQPRTMLQQAWHLISTTDPLIDSDDELGGDEYTREDYSQRLKVINRLPHQQWSHEQEIYPAEMDTV